MLKLLRTDGFLAYVVANGATFAGFQVRNIAQSWLILELTNSSFMVGLINSLTHFTILILSVPGGMIADRINRKQTSLISRFSVALVAVVTAALVFTDYIQLWHLVIACILLGFALAYGNSSFEALMFDLVGRVNFYRAVSFNTIISSVFSAIVPIIGGLLVVRFEISGMFILVAIVYCVSWLSIYPIPSVSRRNSNISSVRSALRDMRDGIKYSFKTPGVNWVMTMVAGVMFWGALQPVIPAYTRDVLGMGAAGYAYMMGVSSIGSVIAALVVFLIGDIRKKSLMLVVSVLFYSIGVVIFGVSTSIYIAYFGMFLSGCAGALIIIVLFTLVQTVVDETVRGRVVGVAQMGMQLLGIGYLGGGLIAEIFGLLLAIIIPAILWVLLAILAYLASREFRSF